MKRKFLLIILTITCFLFGCGNSTTAVLHKMDFALNGTSISEINAGSKEIKYEGNTVALDGVTYDDVQVKGRGNSTWIADVNKKPYQIKFQEASDLAGLGASEKWILLANAFDKTSLRNDFSFYISEKLSIPFSQRGCFTELYADGKYVGLYYLCHKVEIGENEVSLDGDDAVLVEMNTRADLKDDDISVEILDGYFITLSDSNRDDTSENKVLLNDFADAYKKLEKACDIGDFETVSSLIDIKSFADIFLIEMFAGDMDLFSSSFFMYRNAPEERIYAGPIWDMDMSFGNDFRYTGDVPLYEIGLTMHDEYIYKKLLLLDGFKEVLYSEWEKLKGVVTGVETENYFDEMSRIIASSVENAGKENELLEDINYLREYLEKRVPIFETYLSNLTI